MKLTQKILTASLLAMALLPLAASAAIQTQTPPSIPGQLSGNQSPVQSTQDIFNIIGNVFGILRTLFFVLAAFMVLYAAYLYLTSAGDPEKLGSAKNYLIYAAVAVVVALIATGIPTIVATFLGTTVPQ